MAIVVQKTVFCVSHNEYGTHTFHTEDAANRCVLAMELADWMKQYTLDDVSPLGIATSLLRNSQWSKNCIINIFNRAMEIERSTNDTMFTVENFRVPTHDAFESAYRINNYQDALDEVDFLLNGNHKINAIKVARACFADTTLKSAKDWVEARIAAREKVSSG